MKESTGDIIYYSGKVRKCEHCGKEILKTLDSDYCPECLIELNEL